MAYTTAPRDPPPQSQGFRSISPRPGYPIQHPTQIQIPSQLRYPHPHQQHRPPPTSFPNPTPIRRPLPTPKSRPESLKSRPESLPPPARAAQTPAPSRPAPIPAPAPSRPVILAHAASLESTHINNHHTRRPLPNPGAKSTKHASLDLRAQLENNIPTEPDLNSAISSQTSSSGFSPFSAASGASSFSSSAAPSSSVEQSFASPNQPPSSAYSNSPPATFHNTPLHSFTSPAPASSYPNVAPHIDVRGTCVLFPYLTSFFTHFQLFHSLLHRPNLPLTGNVTYPDLGHHHSPMSRPHAWVHLWNAGALYLVRLFH